jgi:membrane protein implicated in regulation of membrane protease activity
MRADRSKTKRMHLIPIPGAILLASMLACRPVITIGWTELAIIALIILVLFAPLLWRLFRFLTREKDSGDK